VRVAEREQRAAVSGGRIDDIGVLRLTRRIVRARIARRAGGLGGDGVVGVDLACRQRYRAACGERHKVPSGKLAHLYDSLFRG